MAKNTLPKPTTLDTETIRGLIEAYNRLAKEPENETQTRFFDYLETLTSTTDPKAAHETLTVWLGQMGETTTTVPTGKLEQLEKERAEREAGQEKARVVSEQEVKNFINQNQQRINQAKKIQATLKDKVIYAKIETPIPPKLTEQEAEFVETIKEAAKANPQQLTLDLTNEIKARIIKNAPGIPSQEAEILAKEAAFTAVQNLVDPTSFDEALILSQVAANPNLIAAQTKQAEVVAEQAALVAASETETFQDAHEVIASVFGKNLALRLIGPATLSEVKVFLSNQPIEGGKSFSLEQIPQQYGQTLDNQNNFVAGLKDFGQEEIKSHLFSKANLWLDNKIAKLPVDSTLAKLYNSPKIRTALSFVGLGRPIEWVGTTFFGKIAVGTGFGPVVGWLGNVTGLKVGVAEAAAKLAPAAGQAITKAGASLLAKVGLSATFAKIGAAIATIIPIPIVAQAVGAFLGWLGGEILQKIPWKKIAPYLLGSLVGIPLLIFGGPVAAVVGGGGVFLLASGAGLAGIGTGILNFFGALGSAFVVTIGTPIIIALVVFPVLVALILFIINSGAYLVPPKPVSESAFGPGTSGYYCTMDKDPVSFSNSTSSPIAKRAWEITADLYQGFWCFWNRSPDDSAKIAQKIPDFPPDMVSYPPSYPELFDENLFMRNPNPTRDEISVCGNCLFWCTYLVQKAYRESHNNSLVVTLWSPTLQADFDRRGKFKSSLEATWQNVVPGSVIFFDVDNSLNRIDHVGIVHTVNIDGVKFVQSNAGSKDDFVPFRLGGKILQNIPGITVVGIGLP